MAQPGMKPHQKWGAKALAYHLANDFEEGAPAKVYCNGVSYDEHWQCFQSDCHMDALQHVFKLPQKFWPVLPDGAVYYDEPFVVAALKDGQQFPAYKQLAAFKKLEPEMRLKLYFADDKGNSNRDVDFTMCHAVKAGYPMDFKQSYAYTAQKTFKPTSKRENYKMPVTFYAGGQRWGDGHAIDVADTKLRKMPVLSSRNDQDNHVPEPGGEKSANIWGCILRNNRVSHCRKQEGCYAQYAFYGPDAERCDPQSTSPQTIRSRQVPTGVWFATVNRKGGDLESMQVPFKNKFHDLHDPGESIGPIRGKAAHVLKEVFGVEERTLTKKKATPVITLGQRLFAQKQAFIPGPAFVKRMPDDRRDCPADAKIAKIVNDVFDQYKALWEKVQVLKSFQGPTEVEELEEWQQQQWPERLHCLEQAAVLEFDRLKAKVELTHLLVELVGDISTAAANNPRLGDWLQLRVLPWLEATLQHASWLLKKGSEYAQDYKFIVSKEEYLQFQGDLVKLRQLGLAAEKLAEEWHTIGKEYDYTDGSLPPVPEVPIQQVPVPPTGPPSLTAKSVRGLIVDWLQQDCGLSAAHIDRFKAIMCQESNAAAISKLKRLASHWKVAPLKKLTQRLHTAAGLDSVNMHAWRGHKRETMISCVVDAALSGLGVA